MINLEKNNVHGLNRLIDKHVDNKKPKYDFLLTHSIKKNIIYKDICWFINITLW